MGEYKRIGEHIKYLRTSKKISITRLAAAAGISKGHLSNIENNSSNPSLQILAKLADALESPIEQIINKPEIPLDPEWIALIHQAKIAGISKDEIRAFFTYQIWKQTSKEGPVAEPQKKTQ